MKTALLLSRSKFTKVTIIAKLLLTTFTFLFCFGSSFCLGAKPSGSRNKRADGISSKPSVMVGAPTISYASPKTYLAGTAIAPLGPKATSVAALAYSNTPVVLGSSLMGLRGMAIDASRNIYITNYTAGLVKMIPAGGGSPISIGSGFIHPYALAVDAMGNVYVADTNASSIKMIPAGGGAVVSIGSGLNGPVGVALDAAGNIYVGDGGTNTIKMIPAAGGAP
ncbi:MAG: NHL repeat-containing protein, partial [Mucilaginibacter sp.]